MRLRSNSVNNQTNRKERILLKDEIKMLLRELIKRNSILSYQKQIENHEHNNSNKSITFSDVN